MTFDIVISPFVTFYTKQAPSFSLNAFKATLVEFVVLKNCKEFKLLHREEK